jgi:tetratricopeptide (TPR) repeat protein
MTDRSPGPRRLIVLAVSIALSAVSGPIAVLAQAPSSETRILNEVSALQQAGRTPEARRILQDHLDRYPASTSALIMLNQIVSIMGEPELVLPYAERAAAGAGTGSYAAHQIWIRALVASDRLDEARAVAREWIEKDPDAPAAYSELAEVARVTGHTEEAISVLVAGRTRIGNADLFSQDLATLYSARPDYASAADEWVTMLAWGDAGIDIVQRGIEAAGPDRDAAIASIDASLDARVVTFQTSRATVYLANRVGHPEWARRRAETLIEGLDPDSRVPFLRQYALDSKNRGYPENAAWAATVLAGEADSPGERLQWRAMAADLAREGGKDGDARQAFEAIRSEADPGTEAHRIALRRLFSMDVPQDLDAAESGISVYAREYPEETRDLAAMAVELSNGALAAGDISRARRALDFAPAAPADASTAAMLEGQRGLVELMAGDPMSALPHLEVAAFIPTRDPASRTAAIALVDALSRADTVESAALGRLMLAVRMGQLDGAAATFRDELDAAPASAGRPAILAIAGRTLESGGRLADAAELRAHLVQAYPAAPEAPPALLALARGAIDEDPGRASSWLEQLVVDYANSAVAPVARRMLAELGGAVPGS